MPHPTDSRREMLQRQLEEARSTLQRLRERRPALIRSLSNLLPQVPDPSRVGVDPARAREILEEARRLWPVSPGEPEADPEEGEDPGEIEGGISSAWMTEDDPVGPGGEWRNGAGGLVPRVAGTLVPPKGIGTVWSLGYLMNLLDALEGSLPELHVRIIALEEELRRLPVPVGGGVVGDHLLGTVAERPGLPAPRSVVASGDQTP